MLVKQLKDEFRVTSIATSSMPGLIQIRPAVLELHHGHGRTDTYSTFRAHSAKNAGDDIQNCKLSFVYDSDHIRFSFENGSDRPTQTMESLLESRR